MKSNHWIVPAILLGTVLAKIEGGVWAKPYAEKSDTRTVARMLGTWKDAKRNRDIPFLICYPKDLGKDGELAPIIIFSHGLGGTRTLYEAHGTHWAAHGYVVIFPQHPGTDNTALATAQSKTKSKLDEIVELTKLIQATTTRFADIPFVINQIEALHAGTLPGKQFEIFKGKLNIKKIGMSGHSLGAITTQALVGEVHHIPAQNTTFTDPRVIAGIAMSPYPPLSKENLPETFASIKVPVLYLTGSNDTFLAKPEERRIPYDHSTAEGTTYLEFQNADHYIFVPMYHRPEKVAAFVKIINDATLAYWDTHLKQNQTAKNWLRQELPNELGKLGKLEQK
ncbi:MAG: hypothetical protein FWD53_07395 [Phycisphaerales bacterium]|nr:hypothetical protein [Phycisphaerales bacterium]